MDSLAALKAAILGILEGFTEYLPVSSTGHLLLAEHFLNLDFDNAAFSKTFVVLVQFGSILALVGYYFRRLLNIALAARHDQGARNFIIGVLTAFLPAALIGALLHGFIKGVLFNPLIVCIALIVGGFILLIVDEMKLPQDRDDATAFPLSMYFKIGLMQCIAMIPGVSRSGATIVGAMLMAPFFLAMPTMAGAFAYDLYKNYKFLTASDFGLVAIGFVTAFISGYIVVSGLLNYVTKHGFKPFAWWRILVGSAGLAALMVWG